MRRGTGLGLCFAFLLTCLPTGQATVLVALDLEDLVIAAPLVVTGEVNKIEVFVDKKRNEIYTRVWISPDEILKGLTNTGTIELKILGGRIGDTISRVPGAPRFEIGERVLLFLEPRRDGDGYLTLGMYQGKYRIFMDPASGVEQVVRARPEPRVRVLDRGAGHEHQPARPLSDVRTLVSRLGGAR